MRHGLMSLLHDFATQVVSVIYVFPASDLCRDVPLFLECCWKACGLCLSVCVCVLMITKRASFHFHHGKKASLRRLHAERGGFGSSAAMNAGMDGSHVFPSRLPVACFFFFKGRMSYLQSMMMGGRLSTNQITVIEFMAAWNSRNKMQENHLYVGRHFFTCFFLLHSYQPTQTCFIPK